MADHENAEIFSLSHQNKEEFQEVILTAFEQDPAFEIAGTTYEHLALCYPAETSGTPRPPTNGARHGFVPELDKRAFESHMESIGADIKYHYADEDFPDLIRDQYVTLTKAQTL